MYNFHYTRAHKRWTEWLNSDDPSGDGDFECLDCIRKKDFKICSRSSVVRTECRVAASGQIFTRKTVSRVSDGLYNGCTRTGLVCRNADQPEGRICDDYEIRFKCAPAMNTLKSMYWWVGILAGLFLVITFIWCLFYLIRKRRRSSESGDADPSLAQPPPSYKDLFGPDSLHQQRDARASVSSQCPLVGREPCAATDGGITSPVFSISDEISRSGHSRQNVSHENDDGELSISIDQQAENQTNVMPSRVHDDAAPRGDNYGLTREYIVTGVPPPPFLPWKSKNSAHRSPFPLLQPYEKSDAPPSYKEALKYLGIKTQQNVLHTAIDDETA